jgi:hypothetical protein
MSDYDRCLNVVDFCGRKRDSRLFYYPDKCVINLDPFLKDFFGEGVRSESNGEISYGFEFDRFLGGFFSRYSSEEVADFFENHLVLDEFDDKTLSNDNLAFVSGIRNAENDRRLIRYERFSTPNKQGWSFLFELANQEAFPIEDVKSVLRDVPQKYLSHNFGSVYEGATTIRVSRKIFSDGWRNPLIRQSGFELVCEKFRSCFPGCVIFDRYSPLGPDNLSLLSIFRNPSYRLSGEGLKLVKIND